MLASCRICRNHFLICEARYLPIRSLLTMFGTLKDLQRFINTLQGGCNELG